LVDKQADAESSTSVPLRSGTALVVDDNETNRRMVGEMLTRFGWRSYLAANGEDAIEALRRARDARLPIQLVVSDVHMPNMDGFALARAILNDNSLATATVMMLSSANHHVDVARCKELRVAAYLIKPISKDQLRNVLAHVCLSQIPYAGLGDGRPQL
jgi:CheY-like chemotaxis protein